VRLADQPPKKSMRWTRWPIATVKVLLRTVPAAVPAIAFLSAAKRVIGFGPVECHECPLQFAVAVGAGLFLCPRIQQPAWKPGRAGRLMCRRLSKPWFTGPTAIAPPGAGIYRRVGGGLTEEEW